MKKAQGFKKQKKKVWLVTAMKLSPKSEELEAEGFNYFTEDYQGKPVAYKLKRLR